MRLTDSSADSFAPSSALSRLLVRVLPLAAAFCSIAADCTIVIDDDDEEEECADLGEVCPSLSCENGNVLDDDGCPICECNAPVCALDVAEAPPPECANPIFDEQTCTWRCELPSECFSDGDCGPGFFCALSDCAPPGDPNDPDGGRDCAGFGVCIPVEGPGCQSDADCGPGFVCEFSGGGGAAPEPPPCRDEDGDGLCDDGSDQIPLPPDGQCVPVEQTCFSDEDCQDGFICEFVGASPGGLVIAAGVCVPPPVLECRADEDCAAGEFCNFAVEGGGGERPCTDADNDGQCDEGDIALPAPTGVCTPLPSTACFSDFDCAADEFCSIGGERPAPCDPNAEDCLVAPEGVCLPRPVDGSCTTDDECTNGQICGLVADCVCTTECRDDGNGGCLPCVCPGVCVDVGCRVDAECQADEFCSPTEVPPPPPPDCDPTTGEGCRMAPPTGVCRDLEQDPCAAVCGPGVDCRVDPDGTVECAVRTGADCTSNADCADGQLCTAEVENDCRPDPNCGPGEACTDVCHGICFDPRDAP